MGKTTGKKVFIECYLSLNDTPSKTKYLEFDSSEFSITGKTLALADTGADVSCVSYSYLRKIFYKNIHILDNNIKPTNANLSTYNNSKIKLKGFISFQLSFGDTTQKNLCHFYVIDDLNNNIKLHCPLIIGLSAIIYLNLDISFFKGDREIIPSVTRTLGGYKTEIRSFFLNEKELNNTVAYVKDLMPGQALKFRVKLHDNFFCQDNDLSLITSEETTTNISVVPTISYIEVQNNEKFSYATVCNHSSMPYSGSVNCKVEPIDPEEYDIMSITQENLPFFENKSVLYDVSFLNDESPVAFNTLDHVPSSSLENLDLESEEIRFVTISTTEPNFMTEINDNPSINFIGTSNFPERDVGYDPNAVDNNCTKGKSLSDERCPIKQYSNLSKEEKENFQNTKDHINLNIQSTEDTHLGQLGGIEVPKNLEKLQTMRAEDVIEWDNFDKFLHPYIKDIFLESYPDVVATNSLDSGDLSYYLGAYHLRLKPNVRLPSQNKIYYLAPTESRHFLDLLQIMEKRGIISKAPTSGDENVFACSAYLVSKKDKESPMRMVIDNQPLNRVLAAEIPVIPVATDIINALRGQTFFSVTDIQGAYNSINITPESRHLAKFVCIHGTYYSNKLLTGAISSPAILHRYMDKVLNYELCKDKNGKVIFEGNLAKLKLSPLTNHCKLFFDDLIVFSEWKDSYEKSLEHHFKIVKRVIERISSFRGKLSLKKSEFFKTRISFLGWNLSANHLEPDPKRIEKVKNFPLPTCVKSWRGFCGSVSSLRSVLGYDCLKNITILAELTSDKADHKNPTPKQIEAFEDIKQKLCQGPIFSCLLDPQASKIIMCDASGAEYGSCGGLLFQIVEPKNKQTYVPPYLSMSDPCHVKLHEHKFQCVPIRYIQPDEDIKGYVKSVGPDYPPDVAHLSSKTFGLQELGYDLNDSMTPTLLSLFAMHNMVPLKEKLQKTCASLSQFLKKDILGSQIRDFMLGKSKDALKKYLLDMKNECKIRIDPSFYHFEALSFVLSRPIIVISSLEEHKKEPIQTFRPEMTKVPFYFLLYKVGNTIVARPSYLDKNETFNLSKYRGTLEVCAYFAKTVPRQMSKNHVLEKECLSIVYALQAFKKMVGTSDCCLLSDSRALYFLYNSSICLSSEKLARWGHKIFESYPQLKICFVKTTDNFADFFTRRFQCKPPDVRLTRLERLYSKVSNDIWDLINEKTFTLEEWKDFVIKNPHFLTHPDKLPNTNPKINAISGGTNICSIKGLSFQNSFSNLVSFTKGVEILKTRLSTDKIIRGQKSELKDLYTKTLSSRNMHFQSKTNLYYIKDGLLFSQLNNNTKIMLPPSMMYLLIGYFHLSLGHVGQKRLLIALDNYHCPGIKVKAIEFIKCCLSCLLSNYDTSVQKYAIFPAATEPFKNIQLDYMSDLPNIDGFKHLIICTDVLTGAIFCHPMRTQASSEFIVYFTYNLFQIFKTKLIYCDNASGFLAKGTLKHLASLGVEVVQSVANSAFSHGVIESKVKIVRTNIRKMLSKDNNLNWLMIPGLITNMINTSSNDKNKPTPFQMLFGDNYLSKPYFDILDGKVNLHPLISKNEKEIIKQKNTWKKMLGDVAKSIDKTKLENNKRVNTGRNSSKTFKEKQIIFVKRLDPKGAQTLYEKSVYVILEVRKTSLICVRMSDAYVTCVHQNHAKIFNKGNTDKVFDQLPPKLRQLCNEVEPDNMNTENLSFLLRIDSFEVPKEISKMIGKDFDKLLQNEF